MSVLNNVIQILVHLSIEIFSQFSDSGTCGAGEAAKPDVCLSMSEQDMMAMFRGSLRPVAAYSSGRLRVQGDLNTAMKLDALVKLIKTPMMSSYT